MDKSLIVKVSGLREPENIREVSALGVDMIGFVFCEKSSRNVVQLPSNAGLIPDRASIESRCDADSPERVGLFVDEMPQNVVTRVYNYKLDYVQFDGSESVVYIDNLKRTLIPDIAPNVKIIKTLRIHDAEDVKQWQQYAGHVDMFLFDAKADGEQFDWSLLDAYTGDIPFILSGSICPEDAARVKSFRHPQFVGIDLNSPFEVSPAQIDTEKLKAFLESF